MLKIINNNLIAGFITVMFISAFSLHCFALVANPQGATPPANDKKIIENFEVNKYLQIKGAQTYLDTEQKKQGALQSFIIKFIQLLTTIIGSFALLVIIAGGVTLLVSHGSSQLQTKGKQMILYAVIGLIVAFLSLIIVTFVQSLFYTD